ncbi:MAG: caspase family protein [Prolixibacteraceae bacterium]|nr:caspase family protein [Prolixibacteraceae bacterium]
MKRIFTLILLAIILIPEFLTAQSQISGKSAPVSLNIRKKKLPPILEISNILFTDVNSNNCIDGLEKCSISFTISNSGTGPAVNMQLKVENIPMIQGLIFNKQTTLSTISPGAKLDVKVPVEGAIGLISGTASIRISFDEQLGFPPDPIDLKIETREFQRPEVKVVDSQILTDNGTVTLGRQVQLQVLVQNTGQGVAENVEVRFVLPPQNVFPNGDERFPIGTLNPGESKNISFEFLPNKIYSGSTIPIKIQVSEKWGTYSQNKEVTASVGSRTSGSAIVISGNNQVSNVAITEGSLSSEVDKNVPLNSNKNTHRYALIIGNEDYTTYQSGIGTESNVAFAVADARSFARYAENTLGIPKENIVMIENALSSVMRREIEKLWKMIQYENGQAEAFVFYAGHGFPDEANNQSYLVPVDITGTNVTDGISLTRLYADLTRFPSKRVTVFLDACFSGGGRDAGLLAARAVRIKPKTEPVTGNLVVFSASTGEQSALPYRDKKHGMFTYFLLKAIQDSKGNINYRQLYDQVKREVELSAIKINGKDQNPDLIYSNDVNGIWEGWKLIIE